jgi:hypothetical protein
MADGSAGNVSAARRRLSRVSGRWGRGARVTRPHTRRRLTLLGKDSSHQMRVATVTPVSKRKRRLREHEWRGRIRTGRRGLRLRNVFWITKSDQVQGAEPTYLQLNAESRVRLNRAIGIGSDVESTTKAYYDLGYYDDAEIAKLITGMDYGAKTSVGRP